MDDKSHMEVAYEALRELIRQRELTPGLLMSEAQLADRLGMSRTPIREAIGRLAHEGLVTVLRKRGIMVSTLSAADLNDLYAVREVLEGLAGRLAAVHISDDEINAMGAVLDEVTTALETGDVEALTRLDVAFHHAVSRASANPRLERMLGQLSDVAVLDELRARMMAAPDRFKSSYDEHRAVFAAISAHDGDGAERAMREHIGASLHWTLEYIDHHGPLRSPAPPNHPA
jgi:DNA-binding GntR family transcriptional regulator